MSICAASNFFLRSSGSAASTTARFLSSVRGGAFSKLQVLRLLTDRRHEQRILRPQVISRLIQHYHYHYQHADRTNKRRSLKVDSERPGGEDGSGKESSSGQRRRGWRGDERVPRPPPSPIEIRVSLDVVLMCLALMATLGVATWTEQIHRRRLEDEGTLDGFLFDYVKNGRVANVTVGPDLVVRFTPTEENRSTSQPPVMDDEVLTIGRRRRSTDENSDSSESGNCRIQRHNNIENHKPRRSRRRQSPSTTALDQQVDATSDPPEPDSQRRSDVFVSGGILSSIPPVRWIRRLFSLRTTTVAVAEEDIHRPREIWFKIADAIEFEKRLWRYQQLIGQSDAKFVRVRHVSRTDWVEEIRSHIPGVVVLLLTALIRRSGALRGAAVERSGGQLDKYSRVVKASPAMSAGIPIKFRDIAGMSEAKTEISEFIDFLKDARRYADLGASVPKGGLLIGPPGTGKTMLARATAGEARVPFFYMSGSDFMEVFVGVGPSRVRDLFAQARKAAPSIIFIDEIDAIGRKRGRGAFSGNSSDERENTLNQLLVEMDGFATGEGVVVLAGTNQADTLDGALTRPGRFDRILNIDLPDARERAEIFEMFLRPLKLHADLVLSTAAENLSKVTVGFSGADIKNLCNEAAILAGRRGATDGVAMCDLNDASDRLVAGLKRGSLGLDAEAKRAVAFHEAGHVVAAWFSEHAEGIHKVSIIPRGQGLGHTQLIPEESHFVTRDALEDRIVVMLGGRASEELKLQQISTGASDDLDKAAQLAYAMVAEWGMYPEVTLLSHHKGRKEGSFYRPHSEHTAQAIDEAVQRLVHAQYEKTKRLLELHDEKLTRLAETLRSQEVLDAAQVENILGPRKVKIDNDVGI